MQGETVSLTLRYKDDKRWDAAMSQHIRRVKQVRNVWSNKQAQKLKVDTLQ